MSDLWSWQNYADAGTFTTNAGEAGELTLANLRDPRVGKPWRATTGGFPAQLEGARLTGPTDGAPLLGPADGAPLYTGVVIADGGGALLWTGGELTIDLGQTRSISCAGVFGSNVDEMTQFEFRFGSAPRTADAWRASIDVSAVRGGMAVATVRNANGFTTASGRYMTLAWTGVPPMEIGRIFVGPPNWRTSQTHSVAGSGFRVNDFSVRSQTRDGAWLIDEAAVRREFTASYDMLDEDELMDIVPEMDRAAGLRRQILFVPDPSVYRPRFPILGHLASLEQANFLRFLSGARSFTIQEDG